jgi:hypothetical protein
MTAFVDQITDALVTALQATDFTAAPWSYSEAVEIKAMSLPDFGRLEASEKLQIRVAAYPNVDSDREPRGGFSEDHKIGIGSCCGLKMESDGVPDETHFRSLKNFVEALRFWAYTGAGSVYTNKAISVEMPAWYDFQKAKSGLFLNTIQITYRLGIEVA